MTLNTEEDDGARKLVVGYLQSSIQHIFQHYKGISQLPPEEQWAIRILKSRQRLINRIFDSKWGGPQAREKAIVELSLSSKDDGSLLLIEGRSHSKGRLDCTACDSDYSGTFPVSLAKLCPSCRKGICHAWEEQPLSQVSEVEGMQAGVSQLGKKWYSCDWCEVKIERFVEIKHDSNNS
jgi:hypothetical protein